jgi:hypothetical protein
VEPWRAAQGSAAAGPQRVSQPSLRRIAPSPLVSLKYSVYTAPFTPTLIMRNGGARKAGSRSARSASRSSPRTANAGSRPKSDIKNWKPPRSSFVM